MPESSLRILIVAENVSARYGGESFLPLHYFRELRKRGVETWLVTHGRVKRELEELYPDDVDRISYVPDLWVHVMLWRLGKCMPRRLAVFTVNAISHLITQRIQRKMVAELVRQELIDVVHEPTPVSPKQPSAIFDVGVPVIVGPMNGGMSYPSAFRFMEGFGERYLLGCLRGLSSMMNRLIPGKRRAALLLVANERTRRALPSVLRGVPTMKIVENGVDLSRWVTAKRSDKSSSESTRFIYVGSLIGLKGVGLLIEAFAAVLKDIDAVLWIVGNGPLRSELEQQARALGVMEKVVFYGFVPQVDLIGLLHDADVFVLPSLHECGGAAVLEAMACGLPVISTNWGGPADYVDDSIGILVEPTSRGSYIEGLTVAMWKMAESEQLRDQLGHNGRRKVEEHYDWKCKIDRMMEVYACVAAGKADELVHEC